MFSYREASLDSCQSVVEVTKNLPFHNSAVLTFVGLAN